MVAYCEKVGDTIPRFEIEAPNDIVDKIIDDLKAYNKSLIYEDKALATEIEMYLKNKTIQEQMKRDREAGNTDMTDEDYIDFEEQHEAFKERDKETMSGDNEEDDDY